MVVCGGVVRQVYALLAAFLRELLLEAFSASSFCSSCFVFFLLFSLL